MNATAVVIEAVGLQLSLQINCQPTGETLYFNLGPHPPRLWPEDIDLTHRLWLRLMDCGLGPKLHHRDVLGLALRRLETELAEGGSQSIVDELKHDVEFRSSLPEAGSPEE